MYTYTCIIILFSLSSPIILTVAKCLEPEAYAPMFEPRCKYMYIYIITCTCTSYIHLQYMYITTHTHTHTYCACTYMYSDYSLMILKTKQFK